MCFKLPICISCHYLIISWNQVYHNKLYNVMWHHLCLPFPPNLRLYIFGSSCSVVAPAFACNITYPLQLLHRRYSRHLSRSLYCTVMLLLDDFSRLRNQFIQNKTPTWFPHPSKMCTRNKQLKLTSLYSSLKWQVYFSKDTILFIDLFT